MRIVSLTSVTRGSDYDDFADRLSSRYTVVILVAFAILVGMNQYVRNPITCWTPNHFSGAHSRYTVRYCWVRNTYYLPWTSQFPPTSGRLPPQPGRRMVPYYQWVPFILLSQAVLFYAPTIIWRAFNSKAGVDADSIMEASQTVARASQPEARDRTLHTLTKHFDRFLGSRRDVTRGHCCPIGLRCLLSTATCHLCGRRFYSVFLTLFYLLSGGWMARRPLPFPDNAPTSYKIEVPRTSLTVYGNSEFQTRRIHCPSFCDVGELSSCRSCYTSVMKCRY